MLSGYRVAERCKIPRMIVSRISRGGGLEDHFLAAHFLQFKVQWCIDLTLYLFIIFRVKIPIALQTIQTRELVVERFFLYASLLLARRMFTVAESRRFPGQRLIMLVVAEVSRVARGAKTALCQRYWLGLFEGI